MTSPVNSNRKPICLACLKPLLITQSQKQAKCSHFFHKYCSEEICTVCTLNQSFKKHSPDDLKGIRPKY